jgi:hypothetical protein
MPVRFGKSFPRRYSVDSAFGFRSAALLAMITTYYLCPPLPGPKAGALVGGIVGILCCEAILLMIFAIAFDSNKLTAISLLPWSSTSWAGLIGFYRTFAVLTALMVGLGSRMDILWEAVAISAAWWWVALGGAALGQTASLAARLIVIALIPAAAFIAVLVGGLVGMFWSIFSAPFNAG